MSDKWDLTLLYESEEDFKQDLNLVKDSYIPKLNSYEGKLSDENSLKEFLSLQREVSPILNKVAMFASMRSDLNKKDVKNATALQEVEYVFSLLNENLSFSEPELLNIGKDKIDSFLKNNSDFSDFDYYFDKLFNGAKYVLGNKEEKLLSYFSQLEGEGSTLYSQLSVADYLPKKVKLNSGEEIEVNLSNWTSIIPSLDDEEDRSKVFESLYSYYQEHKNIYGEIYNTVLQAEVSEVKARGYSSILQSHLFRNKISEDVFHNLIDVASNNNSGLKKYLNLKKEYLHLSKYHTYDRFLKLAKSEKKYTYQEAKDIFFKSIEKFPTDFKDKAVEVTKDGYVDVYHSLGKRTGAYSSGGENIHPFILLNFNGELEDVFTLAHEAGHSIHTLYSEEAQPVMKQDYTIFVAEIASTFNEHNLLDYLMKSGTLSRNDKITLLEKAIDEIMATFYRQTLFGHYEYNISLLASEGKPINHEVLSNEMVKLYKQYYGIDIEEEKVKKYVWAYIPHLFYTPFYVYQYATSFTASMLIYQNVKNNVEGAFDNYIKMLKSGGSTYPIEEVKLAGIDLTKKEAFLSVTSYMDELVDQLEKLLKEE